MHPQTIMKVILLVRYLVVIYVVIVVAQKASAALGCQSVVQVSPAISIDTASEGIVRLRSQNLLTSQYALSGSNQCGPACVVNAFQIVSILAGREPLSSPFELLKEVVQTYFVRPQGMTTLEVMASLKALLSLQFKQNTPQISSVTMVIPGEELSVDRTDTRKISLSNVRVARGQMKILKIALMDSNLNVSAAHFVVVEDVEESKLKTLDPRHPDQSFESIYLGQANWTDNDIPVFEYTGKAMDFGSARFAIVEVITIDVSDAR